MTTTEKGLAALQPQTYAELVSAAGMIARSRLFAVQSEDAAAVIMMTAASLGIDPVAGMRGIHVVQGRAVLSADMMVAVVHRSGLCARWTVVESTAERCVIEALRVGSDAPTRHAWTMEMARKAGLASKPGPWQQFPHAMLRARCSADLARMCFPDVLFGVYAEGEIPEAPVVADVQHDTSSASRQIATPATIEVFRADVKDCGTLREILTAWQTWAADLARDGAAEDARAIVCQWIADTHDVIVATEVQTLLSNAPTVPAAYCALYDALTAAGTVDAAAQAWHGRGALDGWYATAARQMVGRDLKGRGLGRAQVLATLDAPPPPDGTDDPHAPRSAANDTASAEGSAVPSSGTDGPVARDDGGAWTLSAKGIRDHVAAITNARHLESSGRSHLREVSPTLKVHALHCYTARLRELSCREERDEEGGTVVTQTPQDVAFARVETWLREGPKDAAPPPQRRTRRAA